MNEATAEAALTRRLSTRACSAGLLLAAALVSGCVQAAPAAQDARAIDAPQLFAQACAKCHADGGSGGLTMATNGPRPIDLRDPEWQRSRSDGEIAAAIRDGRGAMPPFNDVLTPEQIAALGRHVRTLRKP
ncbi:MAG: c-type cytochrome [Vicinamibacterales bacterium]